MSKSFTATGNIPVSRFVALDTSVEYGVALCGANGRGIGISQMGARANSLLDSTDPPLAAIDGEQLEVIRDSGHVEYGGTVTRGDYLISDANGKAVKATETVAGTVDAGQDVIARALESGTSGTLGFVEVKPFQA